MDAPPIQYVTTSDGVKVAYWTLGGGLPVIVLNAQPLSHLQAEWRVPALRAWYEGLARAYQTVRINFRGTRLAGGTQGALDLEGYVRDLGAVADALSADGVAVMASGITAPVAVAYAASHPARLVRLVLFNPFLGAQDDDATRRVEASRAMSEIGLDIWVRMLISWLDPDGVDRSGGLEALLRGAVSPESHRRMIELFRSIEIETFAEAVAVPTLTILRRENTRDHQRKAIAATVSGSRTRTVEGSAIAPYFQGAQNILRVVTEFLGHDRSEAHGIFSSSRPR